MTFDATAFTLGLLKRPTDRDQQYKVGASNFSTLCTRCLADDLLRTKPDIMQEHNPWWLGAVIGTATHALLEERGQGLPGILTERKIVLGELPGYGVIKSTMDLYHEPSGTVGDYKGLDLDTPLPTPTGWTTMRQVKVGDNLIDQDGLPTTVVGKSDVRHLPGYVISFEDGTEVTCDHEHLWNVALGNSKRDEKIVTLSADEVFRVYQTDKKVRIYNSHAFDVADVSLPIDPYVLGVWLGDGSAGSGRITCGASKIGVWGEISSRGWAVGDDVTRGDRGCETRNIEGLNRALRLLGIKNNKHIPMSYLRASYSQRLDLLRGYMDADGYYNPIRKRVVMTTTSLRQAEDLKQLVLSLGWKTLIQSYIATWQGGEKQAYMLEFNPDVNPFLVRNVGVSYEVTTKSTRRIITGISALPEVTTQCVMVDSPTSTYLCTENWLPTHNTTTKEKLVFIKRALLDEPDEFEVSKVTDARFKVSGYINQALSYGRGMVLAGYDVKNVVLIFVCRDGSGDKDVWSYTIPYDQEQADKVWLRLERLWAWLQEGNDPRKLPSHDNCYYCCTQRDYTDDFKED